MLRTTQTHIKQAIAREWGLNPTAIAIGDYMGIGRADDGLGSWVKVRAEHLQTSLMFTCEALIFDDRRRVTQVEEIRCTGSRFTISVTPRSGSERRP